MVHSMAILYVLKTIQASTVQAILMIYNNPTRPNALNWSTDLNFTHATNKQKRSPY